MPDDVKDEAAAEAAAEKTKADAEAETAKIKADADDVFDKDRAMALIQKLRDEVKTAKQDAKKATDLETKLKEYEDAQLSEREKLEKKLADYQEREEQAAAKLRRANLIAELSKPDLGIVNAQAAAKLIDGVEYNDDGDPSNLDGILEQFLTANPFLKGAPSKAKPAGTLNSGDGQQGGDKPALTADQLEWAGKLGMTVEEYAAYKAGDTMTLDEAHQARENLAAAAKQ